MTDRPILMSAPMVRALLAGTKTQTRRVITDRNSRGNYRASELLLHDKRTFADPGPSPAGNPGWYLHAPVNAPAIEKRMGWKAGDCDPSIIERLYPWVFAGDTLWVRESGSIATDKTAWMYEDASGRLAPAAPAGSEHWCREWKACPSIHMPRWASRITLEVTGVRVERLQDISEVDAIAEGVSPDPGCRQDDDAAAFQRIGAVRDDSFPIARYAALWESINGPGSWDANPWVWALSFNVRKAAQ